MTKIILDATALTNFAAAGLLVELRNLLAGDRVVTTHAVRDEIRRGSAKYPALAKAVDLDWVEIVRIQDSLAELGVLAEYTRRLGSRTERDLGEATVLTWAEMHGAVVLTDDSTARQIGTERKLSVHGTLWLLARAVRSRSLSFGDACTIVDRLLDAGAYLPCNGSQFREWAEENGLLPD